MSNRERWILYPLLLLALGAALRNKFTGELNAPTISCQRLLIADRDGTLRASLAMTAQQPGIDMLQAGRKIHGSPTQIQSHTGGSLVLYSPAGRPLVIMLADENAGALETFDKSGAPQTIIGSSNGGGSLTTFDAPVKTILGVGRTPYGSGVFASNPSGLYAAPLISVSTKQRPASDGKRTTKPAQTPPPSKPQPPAAPGDAATSERKK